MPRPNYLSEGLKERLKQARHSLTPKRGAYVSQEQLAKEVGLTGVTLGNYEGGITEPSLQIIERLARVLNVSPSWLAFGEGRGLNGIELPSTPPLKPPKELLDEVPKTRRRPA